MKHGDIFYDVYDESVTTLKFIEHLNDSYSICVVLETDKPIAVFTKRLYTMFTDRTTALLSLKQLLLNKIHVIDTELNTISAAN